jgi:hypothetical protein
MREGFSFSLCVPLLKSRIPRLLDDKCTVDSSRIRRESAAAEVGGVQLLISKRFDTRTFRNVHCHTSLPRIDMQKCFIKESTSPPDLDARILRLKLLSPTAAI